MKILYYPILAFMVALISTIVDFYAYDLARTDYFGFWAICIGSVSGYTAVMASVHEDLKTDRWVRMVYSFWLVSVISLALILQIMFMLVTVVYGIGVGKAVSNIISYNDVMNYKKYIVGISFVCALSLAIMACFS